MENNVKEEQRPTLKVILNGKDAFLSELSLVRIEFTYWLHSQHSPTTSYQPIDQCTSMKIKLE